MSLALLAAPAAAIPVTTTDDENGTNPAACSLREAIQTLNTSSSFGGCTFTTGDNEVLVPAGTYTFVEDPPFIAPLRIQVAMIVRGAGSLQTELDFSTIFDSPGIAISPPAGEVTLEGLTIANLQATDTAAAVTYSGGAGRRLLMRDVVVRDNEGYNPPGLKIDSVAGGSIRLERVRFERNYNNGIGATAGGALSCITSGAGTLLLVRDSVFERNEVSDKEGMGGGLLNFGCDLELENVLFTGNLVFGEGGSMPGGGGGLASFTRAGISHEVRLTNVTFFENADALDGRGGGALFSDQTSGSQSVWLANLTFSANVASQGDDLAAFSTPVSLTNVLLGSTGGGQACSHLAPFTLTSGGGNLDTDGSCALTGPGDQTVADPGLAAALADNGGLTPTLALLPGSPAIDNGNPGVCAATDQRGVFRPQDGDGNGSILCDAGAYEVESAAFLFGDGFESGDTEAWTRTVP